MVARWIIGIVAALFVAWVFGIIAVQTGMGAALGYTIQAVLAVATAAAIIAPAYRGRSQDNPPKREM